MKLVLTIQDEGAVETYRLDDARYVLENAKGNLVALVDVQRAEDSLRQADQRSVLLMHKCTVSDH